MIESANPDVVLKHMREEHGLDRSGSRPNTPRRCLAACMARTGADGYEQYLQLPRLEILDEHFAPEGDGFVLDSPVACPELAPIDTTCRIYTRE